MAGEHPTPGTAGHQAGQAGSQRGGFRIDLDQLTQELAQELGVDPANLQAGGPADQQVRAYEAQSHSRTQQNNR